MGIISGLILLMVSGVGHAAVCEFSLNGMTYNLKELDMPTPLEFYSNVTQPAMIFYLNLCEPIKMTGFSSCYELQGNKESVVAMSVNYQACTGWGLLPSETPWKITDGVLETSYVVAQPSGVCTASRTANVRLYCNKGVQSYLSDVKLDGPCSATFSVQTPAACGSGTATSGLEPSGVDPGSVVLNQDESGSMTFFMIILVAFLLYCSVGCFLNTRNEGKQGIEAFPNIDFWRALPGMIVAVFNICFEKILALFNNRESYQTFNSAGPRTPGASSSNSFAPSSLQSHQYSPSVTRQQGTGYTDANFTQEAVDEFSDI
mmetsp:Transcript_5460/g.8456  ORF Transcript_5460/g.8456 Transcript_5460/m.8456 type:complete len:317 (-) Transcript_5460:28-978(-)